MNMVKNKRLVTGSHIIQKHELSHSRVNRVIFKDYEYPNGPLERYNHLWEYCFDCQKQLQHVLKELDSWDCWKRLCHWHPDIQNSLDFPGMISNPRNECNFPKKVSEEISLIPGSIAQDVGPIQSWVLSGPKGQDQQIYRLDFFKFHSYSNTTIYPELWF